DRQRAGTTPPPRPPRTSRAADRGRARDRRSAARLGTRDEAVRLLDPGRALGAGRRVPRTRATRRRGSRHTAPRSDRASERVARVPAGRGVRRAVSRVASPPPRRVRRLRDPRAPRPHPLRRPVVERHALRDTDTALSTVAPVERVLEEPLR